MQVHETQGSLNVYLYVKAAQGLNYANCHQVYFTGWTYWNLHRGASHTERYDVFLCAVGRHVCMWMCVRMQNKGQTWNMCVCVCVWREREQTNTHTHINIHPSLQHCMLQSLWWHQLSKFTCYHTKYHYGTCYESNYSKAHAYCTWTKTTHRHKRWEHLHMINQQFKFFFFFLSSMLAPNFCPTSSLFLL